jgi:hypothetical protein
MHRVSIVLRALSLFAMCISCAASGAPEARPSSPPEPIRPAGRLFKSAIAVRDESTTAFFGWLATGERPPSTLAITFRDGAGAVYETLSNLDVQVSSSGLVYAAPRAPLPGIRQERIKNSVSAELIIGSDVEPLSLGQAEGTISRFREGYRESQVAGVDGGGCPHCLAYFLCCCMETTYGVIVDRKALGCSRFAKCQYPCTVIKDLVPVPR